MSLIHRFLIFPYGKTLIDKVKLVFFTLMFPIYFILKDLWPSVSTYIAKMPFEVFISYKNKILALPTFDSINHFSQLFFREKNTLEAIKYDKRKKFFIDVGAHIGTLAIFWTDYYEGGIMIEPNPSSFKVLKKNIKINNIRNALLIPQGAFSKNEHKKLFLNELNSGRASIKEESSTPIIIEVKRLDYILKEKKIDPQDISFIKIDVEGAELEVLKGAKEILKRGKPIIVFEAWNTTAFNRVKRFLEDFKYNRFIRLDKYNYVGIRNNG